MKIEIAVFGYLNNKNGEKLKTKVCFLKKEFY